MFGDDEFECLADLPAGALVWFHQLGAGPIGAAKFIQTCLADEADEERLLRVLSSRERIVRTDVLLMTFAELAGYYTAHPTQRSAVSAGGPLSTGNTSTADSAATVSDSQT